MFYGINIWNFALWMSVFICDKTIGSQISCFPFVRTAGGRHRKHCIRIQTNFGFLGFFDQLHANVDSHIRSTGIVPKSFSKRLPVVGVT